MENIMQLAFTVSYSADTGQAVALADSCPVMAAEQLLEAECWRSAAGICIAVVHHQCRCAEQGIVACIQRLGHE